MASTPFPRLQSQSASIVKATRNTTNNIRKKTSKKMLSTKPLTEIPSIKGRSKEITMLTRLLILNSSQRREDQITECRSKEETYSIIKSRLVLCCRCLSEEASFKPLISFNKKRKSNKKPKPLTSTKKREMHNLWSHNEWKRRAKENKNNQTEGSFRRKFTSKIKSKHKKSYWHEKMLSKRSLV